ncbi:MAG TPA: hypothetical protein VF545_03290 [Thermoleophilaceae bacterium]
MLAAFLAAAAPTLAATPRTETAVSGQVQAKFSYQRESDFQYRDVHMEIRRAGRIVLDAPVPAPCRECPVIPAGAAAGVNSMSLVDLEKDGEPEAVVDLYTGGAHCCTYSVIYGYRAAGDSYGRLVHGWGDPSYQLVDIDHDGRPELRSADDAFAYAFTAYLFSGLPVQVWHYGAGRLVDVTRNFPNTIRADLKSQASRYRTARREKLDVRGVLAAYVADQYLLGQGKRGWRVVRNAYRRGELKAQPGDFGAHGKRYIKALRRFLRKRGYR